VADLLGPEARGEAGRDRAQVRLELVGVDPQEVHARQDAGRGG
jgi:hypothetical protein